jgi:DNA-binding HxlR family transcriptional regulator
MRKTGRKSDCPINYAMEIFGDRWTFLIVRDLMFKNKSHYNDFLHAEEKMATNILANRLQLLEENNIIIKEIDPTHGSKWIYSLTPKGIDLLPLLVEMIVWSAKHDKKTAADKAFVKKALTNREKLLQEINAALTAKN